MMPAMDRHTVTALSPYRRVPSGVHPPEDPAYRSTVLRHPLQPLVQIPQTLSEITGPSYPYDAIGPIITDLTTQHAAPPIGERIIVDGRVLDENGRPVPRTLVEIWQANACGKYGHEGDTHDAPLDPNFTGTGRTITDEDGRYRFITIKPGHYPWGNHDNAWRPAHIHFSFLGPGFLTRLVTQMYFPGDPLFALDPIFNSVRDPEVRQRMVSSFDIGLSVPDWALGFRWDVVLRGREATPALY
jgi:protocatechuate 3,4-dioxygenase beta subunit